MTTAVRRLRTLWKGARRRIFWRPPAARQMQMRADHQRAAGRWREAAVLYTAAHDFGRDEQLLVQAGHMFKEAGDWPSAERAYLAAFQVLDDDPDLVLQLGHFYKRAGQVGEAARWYDRAVAMDPQSVAAREELQLLAAAPPDDTAPLAVADREGGADASVRNAGFGEPEDVVVMRHLGRHRLQGQPAGRPVLGGVVSLRGVCVSTATLVTADLLIDDIAVAHVPMTESDRRPNGLVKYVFHFWYDLSAMALGSATVDIRIWDDQNVARSARHDIQIAAPWREADHPDTDAVVDGPADPQPDPAGYLAARSSMVREARTRLLNSPPATILVVRADQMGDMAVSVPALRRLRALAPDARLIGLVTSANIDLARSLGIFDTLEVVSWAAPTIGDTRRLTGEEQDRITEVMRSYRPDVAIDLVANDDTRPLLKLSGAPCTIGFDRDGRWPWLTLALSVDVVDECTGHEIAPHAAKLRTLVAAFAAMLTPAGETSPLRHNGADRLARFGLTGGSYVILHAGGRLAFSRWPGYGDLAARLLAETPLAIVLFGGGDLPELARHDPRVTTIDGELPFDDFDALLSCAAVFVGNDSGPKHLAAFRGTPVVSIHSSRIDWREWGQTQTGVIISRRLPCAGCALHGRWVTECGRGYACVTDIRVDEVLGAVKSLLV